MLKVDEQTSSFLTAYYVLLAYISHSTSCWLWEGALNQNVAASWFTFNFDLSHDYRFYAVCFLTWLFFTFSCALFPTIYALRLFSFLSTIYILMIGNLFQSGFFLIGDALSLIPLGALGLMPARLINQSLQNINSIENRLSFKFALIILGIFTLFWYPRFTYNFGLISLIGLLIFFFSKKLDDVEESNK